MTWSANTPGVVQLPSGRRIRGRSLRRERMIHEQPAFGVYFSTRPLSPEPQWDHQWVRWLDFWLPSDKALFHSALLEAWTRAHDEKVEVACGGGVGRTGTALAYLAVLDGVDPLDAVSFVRSNYKSRAVETPWQRHFIETLDLKD